MRSGPSCGLKVAGTLAVIRDGAMRGLFDGQAVIEKLGRTNFYASPELLAAVSEKLTNITASPAPDLRSTPDPRGGKGD